MAGASTIIAMLITTGDGPGQLRITIVEKEMAKDMSGPEGTSAAKKVPAAVDDSA
jgi:hypothetical protein